MGYIVIISPLSPDVKERWEKKERNEMQK